MSKAWEHRMRHHHPRIIGTDNFCIYQVLILGYQGFLKAQVKPRCTFAELGKDCPIVEELESGEGK